MLSRTLIFNVGFLAARPDKLKVLKDLLIVDRFAQGVKMGDIRVSHHPFCPDYFPKEPFELPVNFFYPLGSLTHWVAFRSQSNFRLYFQHFPLAVGMKDFCSLSLSTLPNTFPIKVPCLTAAQYNPYGCNVLRNLSISGVFYILSVICGTWP